MPSTIEHMLFEVLGTPLRRDVWGSAWFEDRPASEEGLERRWHPN